MRNQIHFFVIILILQTFNIYSQTTNLGSGSYTNSFPGKDSANRNDYPTGSPQVTGIAAKNQYLQTTGGQRLLKKIMRIIYLIIR